MPQFEKGNPGRPEGSKNKVTKDLVSGVLDVFEKVGGWEGMVNWLEENPRKNKPIFYNWILKMLPSNVNLDSTDGLQITIGSAFQPKKDNDKDSNTSDGS